MTDLPEYSHLSGIGKPFIVPTGMTIRRKFRWVVQLFKNRKEIKKAQFVKVHSRPNYQPSREPPHLPDLDYFFDIGFDCWIHKEKNDDWTVEDLTAFDEVVLALFDGCGCMLERWTMGDITRKPFPMQGADVEFPVMTKIWLLSTRAMMPSLHATCVRSVTMASDQHSHAPVGVQKNEAMCEDDYDAYEVTYNYCVHNYENFVPQFFKSMGCDISFKSSDTPKKTELTENGLK